MASHWPCFCRLTLSPFFSVHALHLSSLTSIISLSGSHNTRSSANNIAQGVSSSISSVCTSIMITNNSGLSAEPFVESNFNIYLFGLSRTGHDACLAPSIYVPECMPLEGITEYRNVFRLNYIHCLPSSSEHDNSSSFSTCSNINALSHSCSPLHFHNSPTPQF